MKVSDSQQQLLSFLNISLLELRTEYTSETLSLSGVPDLQQELVQDVLVLFPEPCLSLENRLQWPGFSWQIDSSLSTSQLDNNGLLTPELPGLKTAEAKKSLWLLLQQVIPNDL